MTATTADIVRLAKLARSFLRTGNRLTTGEPFVYFDGSAPEWVKEMPIKCHGDLTSNDWSYWFIQDALSHLADDLNPDDDPTDSFPDLDSLYPYTGDRLNWLASHLDRPGYCDEAAEEYDVDGKYGNRCAMTDRIGYGMMWELHRVYRDVLAQVEKQAEAERDD